MSISPVHIIITGASKGIGKAIGKAFGKRGAIVVINARGKEALETAKAEIEATHENARVHTFQTDMANKEEVNAFADGALQALNNKVDVLVNNAGVFVPGNITDEEDGALEKMINTNLYSAYYLTRALLPTLKAGGKGFIVNMCSVASLKAYPAGGSYAISKFALLGFSKGLREELKEDGIKVTSLMPGATLTASWEGVDLPESRFIDAEEVGELVWDLYKMSDRTVVEDVVIRPMLGDI